MLEPVVEVVGTRRRLAKTVAGDGQQMRMEGGAQVADQGRQPPSELAMRADALAAGAASWMVAARR